MSLINTIPKYDKGSQSIVTIPLPRFVSKDGISSPVEEFEIHGTPSDYSLKNLDKSGVTPSEIDVQNFSQPSSLEFSDFVESSFNEEKMFNKKSA